MASKHVDRSFALSIILLVVGGFIIFFSASFGLLAQSEAQYSSVAFNQIVFGLVFGTIACIGASRLDYKKWKQYSFFILIGAIILNLLVFVPGLGLRHAGSLRWLLIGDFTIQPGEFLRLAIILYYGALVSVMKEKTATFRYGLLPLLGMIALGCGILLAQGDTELVLPVSLVAMYMVGGGRWRDLFILFLIGVIAVGGLVMTKPYLMDRINTFINPAADSLGSGYQIQQSLIAIGSGQILGRGFGQSVQKFNFLPEPIGDSIFAVASEEFGFVGSIIILALYLFFALRGFKIAVKTNDIFGRLFTVGIVIMLVVQSFMNIGSMLGIVPLTGVPLVFISHGGTSLLLSLFAVGIILSVSRYKNA